nr:reverse transcriptase domain-containing protein [Tanacetum cinerariifolium]
MDDEPMWVVDRVVAPTLGFAITIPETANEFAIKEEDFDALLEEGSEILHSIAGTILEEKLFAEFDEFIAITTDENSESESDTEEPPFEKITFNVDYKTKTSLEEPPMDLELKPLLDNLEYVFLEEPSFLPIIISSQLSDENKNKLISFLKNTSKPLLGKPQTFLKSVHLSVNIKFNSWKAKNKCTSWEKCHFIVKEGIVLGHKVSEAGLEVDKAKIKVISKIPPPLRSKLLEKDIPFEFNKECHNAFKLLKEKLTCALVTVSLNWNLSLNSYKKGTENVAADRLSQIENDETSDDSEVDDNFPGETIMEINTKDEPWFPDFANYLVSDIIPKGMRHCVSGPETQTISNQCHHRLTSGHYGPNTTAKKVLDSGFYCPTIIKGAHTQVRLCEACKKTGNISKHDEMPLNSIQVCEIFDIWGIDFIRPFLKSYKFEYILVVVDYVSKWAEAQALPINDARVVIIFLKKIFYCFRITELS